MIPYPRVWLIPQNDSEGSCSPPPHSLVSEASPFCAGVCTHWTSTPLVLDWQCPVPPPATFGNAWERQLSQAAWMSLGAERAGRADIQQCPDQTPR